MYSHGAVAKEDQHDRVHVRHNIYRLPSAMLPGLSLGEWESLLDWRQIHL